MSEELIKAIWAAGYRTGHHCGSDAVASFEAGGRSNEPQNPEKAWQEYVEPYGDYHTKLNSVEYWEDIP